MQFMLGSAEVPPHPHRCSRDRPASVRLGLRRGTGPHGGFLVGAVSLSASNFLFFHEFISLPPRHLSRRLVCKCKPRCRRTHLRTSVLALRAAQARDNPTGCFNHLVWSFFFSRYLDQTAQSKTLRLSRAMPPGKRHVRL